jgi:hypothetical protein
VTASAGRLLAHLQREFQGFEREDLDRGVARFSSVEAGLDFTVREIVQSDFLMQTVIAQFECSVAATHSVPLHLRVRHRGAFRRTGVTFDAVSGNGAAIEALGADAGLLAALLPLDFTRCELTGGPSGWQIEVQHYGASEVIGRLPGLCRYIPLIPSQRDSLLAAFQAFRRVLAN